MNTKNIVLTGLIITALVTGVILVDIIPVLPLAFIALLAGLGLSYYAGLSRNRIEYIGEQRLLLEFAQALNSSYELSETAIITRKYSARIMPGANVVLLTDSPGTGGNSEDLEGLELIRSWMKENPGVLIIEEPNSCPVDLSIPAHIKSLLAIPVQNRSDRFGMLFLINKKDQNAFTVRQIEMLEFIARQAGDKISQLEDKRNQRVYLLNLLKALIRAIEGEETGFAGHSERVAEISSLLGVKLGLNDTERQDLYYSSLLHDIGKLRSWGTGGLEMGDLDPEDHPGQGALILQGVPGLDMVRESILYHHERYDGSGGPQGLSATEIPFNARIIAVADIYDALTKLCVQEERLSHKEALETIKRGSGSILDPLVVVALEEVEAELGRWQEDKGEG